MIVTTKNGYERDEKQLMMNRIASEDTKDFAKAHRAKRHKPEYEIIDGELYKKSKYYFDFELKPKRLKYRKLWRWRLTGRK